MLRYLPRIILFCFHKHETVIFLVQQNYGYFFILNFIKLNYFGSLENKSCFETFFELFCVSMFILLKNSFLKFFVSKLSLFLCFGGDETRSGYVRYVQGIQPNVPAHTTCSGAGMV